MTRRAAALAGVAALVAAGAIGLAVKVTASGDAADSGARGLPGFGPGNKYRPAFEGSTFSPNIDNPWFPLSPGKTLIYEGTKDGRSARNVFAVTSDTLVVGGVTTRVVFDQLFLDGQLAEKTFDYYAQDALGNVWYFGEDTTKLDDHGNLSDTDGSFRAGVDEAQPGLFMQARPEVGRQFRQEWYQGHAEDQFKVVELSAPVTVPFGSYKDALRTEETTALEPDVLDNKYYVSGIGEVEEVSVKGPVEKLVLVEVRTA